MRWLLLLRLLPETRWGDWIFAVVHFRLHNRRWPNVQHPSLNDELFRIKVSGELSDPLRVLATDKEFAKLLIQGLLGPGRTVPTLAVLRTEASLRAFNFPPDCVIKPTHGSGDVIVRRGNETLDLERIVGWLGWNYYRRGRETNYRTLRPGVIVEPRLFDGRTPLDYRVFCVHGRFLMAYVYDAPSAAIGYFDRAWQPLGDVRRTEYATLTTAPRPGAWDEMVRLSEQASVPFGLIRVDWYCERGDAVMGELTNCSNLAGASFTPESTRELTRMLAVLEGGAAASSSR